MNSESHPWIPEPRDDNWIERHQQLVNNTLQHAKDERIVFIGDSITEGWTWDQKSQKIWDKHYTPRRAYNYGVSADKTQHLLWRIEHKEFDGLNPKVVVLMIGTNNLFGNTIEDITRGVQQILDQLSVKMPLSKVILLGVLPQALLKKAKQLNVLLKELSDEKTIFWLDMWTEFTNNEGKQRNDLYLVDRLHLNYLGYEVWHKTMEPLLNKLNLAH